MNPKKQQTAIAEFCGYRRYNPNVGPSHEKVWGWWSPNGKFYIGDSVLPDYLNDLNAIAIAETLLIDRDIIGWLLYCDELRKICDKNYGYACAAYHALAKERSEALIKSLSLWVETPPFKVPDKVDIGKKTGPLRL